MTAADYLLLRSAGAVWGIPKDDVTAIRRRPHGVLVETRRGPVVADEVVVLAEGLEVRTAGALMRRFAGHPSRGLAVHQGLCVAIVDPGHPPEALRDAAGRGDGGQEHDARRAHNGSTEGDGGDG